MILPLIGSGCPDTAWPDTCVRIQPLSSNMIKIFTDLRIPGFIG
jgi:hypothetical protein